MNIPKIRLIEELAANAWRPEIEQHVGGWRLRYSGGKSRRVNSVWPSAPPNLESIEAALEIAEAFYQQRSAIPYFQLCPAALPVELPQMLADRGYTFGAYTEMQIQPIQDVLSRTEAPAAKVVASPTLTDGWFGLYTSAAGYPPERLPIRHGILSRIGPPAHFVWLESQGEPAATGLGVVERGWLGVFCVVTATPFRRHGLAIGLMHTLAQWGKQQGAENVYLQVMERNLPALNLYRKLGFNRMYRYYYAAKGGEVDESH